MCRLLLARLRRKMLLVAVCLSPLGLVHRAAGPPSVVGLARLVLAGRCLLLLGVLAALDRAAASASSLAMLASPALVAVSALWLARARVLTVGG